MADISQPEEPPFGKRKRSSESLVRVSDPLDTATYHSTKSSLPGSTPLPKRPRLPIKIFGIGLLPPDLLQHVFSYVDPFSLASLAAVSRSFRSILDERYTEDLALLEKGKNQVKSPDVIWSQSRRRYLMTMPKPVGGLSERAQFLLAFGLKCNFCGKIPSHSSPVPDPWHAGPGEYGVRIIWPFKIRSCKDCLVARIEKDTEILLSDAFPLLPGLPFALFTQFMDYVPETLVRDGLPFEIKLQKFYFKSEIASLGQQLQQARSYGAAATEEWLKGLPHRGKVAQADATRFQQWESQGQLQALRQGLDYRFIPEQPMSKPRSTVHSLPARPPTANVARNPSSGAHIMVVSALPPMPSYGLAPGLAFSHTPTPTQSDSMSMDSQRSTGTNRATKSSRERARIRSHKKADIVERCRKLVPPITKEQLEELDAFDDALKIPIPLNDNSWTTLRDSLQQQRRKVMLEDEARNAVRTAPVPGIYAPPTHTDEFLLAHAGTSKREKLCKISEDFIRQKWGYGGFVTYPTSPQFAAEVLIHTRRAYEDDKARTSTIQASSGYVPLPTHQEYSLKLEDMKWVFDQTIKPRTEQIRKDLFICPECPTIGSVKYFAFESIIQHYASKHTDTFSRGTQMVNWKADWPITPPFSEHPERICTPTPSITHTPTLTNVPLSTISSGSILTSTIPSAGWHTPDNMSLASSTSRSYSIKGSSAAVPSSAATAPGPGMYESQREYLSLSLSKNLTPVSATSRTPTNLRLYLTIALAVAQFKEKWSNLPGLALFKDCLQAKRELEIMRDAEHLRCAECAAAREHDSRARWSLLDLVVHFQRVHIDQNNAEFKPDWRNDMILLPEPETVKYEQSDPAVPEFLKQYFAEAVTTATIQFTNTTVPKSQQVRRNESEAYRSHDITTHDLLHTSQSLHLRADYNEDDFYRSSIMERSYLGRPWVEPSMAATYGESTITRDTSSVLQHNSLYDDPRYHRPPSVEYRRGTQWLQARHTLPPQIDRESNSGQINLPQAESMTRTNTVRSYKGRDESRTTMADDFLSTIDAYVDTEMADPQPHHDTGESTTRALSLPYEYTIAAQPASFETRTRYVYEPRAGIEYNNMDDVQAMRREPSRVVEFDEDGTPISYAGQVYQEISPQRRRARHRTDAQPHTVVPIGSNDSRIYWQYERNYNTGDTDQSPQRIYLTQSHRGVQYITEPSRHIQRSQDAESNHWYVETSPPMRRYIEIDDSDHRTLSAHSASDRSTHYHGPDMQDHISASGSYPSRLLGYEDRTNYRQ